MSGLKCTRVSSDAGGMTGVWRVRRGNQGERGFTLVEVLLVTAVVGVLLTIAIPAFLGVKGRAQDRGAQASLRIAITNAKALYADNESFAKVTVATLGTAEPSLRLTSSPSAGPNMVAVHSGSGGIALAAQSKSGICYVVGDAANAAGTVFMNLGSASCDPGSIADLPTTVPTEDHAVPGGDWAKAW